MHARRAPLRLGGKLTNHVLDHRTPEVRRVLHQRLARDLADQILAGDAGLEVLVELRHRQHARRGAIAVHHECHRGARIRALLALHAIREPLHAHDVILEPEHLGRTDIDTRLAADAAIVVDRVQERHDRIDRYDLGGVPARPRTAIIHDRAEAEQRYGNGGDREWDGELHQGVLWMRKPAV